MVEVLVMFPKPEEPSALEAFVAAFVPDLESAPGCRSVRVSTGDVMSRGGPPPYVRIVEATFDSLGDWMGWVMAPARAQHQQEFDRFRPVVVFFEATAT
jgi:hypothetical protein